MSETDIQRQIQLALSDRDTRLWRNNVGQGWQGHVVSIREGVVTLSSARRIQFGLAPGSSDLIGTHSVIVTPEMVGTRVALFTAIEVKSLRGRATEEQAAFLQTVQALGGLSGLARSLPDARLILNQGKP